MVDHRFTHPTSRYAELFDLAVPRFYPGEAEIVIDLDGEELTISLPVADGEPDGEASATARSVLLELGELDRQAAAFLFALDSWPYGRTPCCGCCSSSATMSASAIGRKR